jgi:hypothetical protein
MGPFPLYLKNLQTFNNDPTMDCAIIREYLRNGGRA